jgi:hypothetical protein
MTRKTNQPKRDLPKVNPQPVQLKFLQAKESIVFFGGGAGGK